MAKEKSNNLKPIGNEKSYTPEFFDILYDKISLTDSNKKIVLRRTIILATQAYVRNYAEYLGQLASHEIEKELKKVVNHINKAEDSLIKIYESGNYGEDIVDNLYEVISKKYPSLHGVLKEIKRGDGHTVSIKSPVSSLPLLSAMGKGIERTIQNFPSHKQHPKALPSIIGL